MSEDQLDTTPTETAAVSEQPNVAEPSPSPENTSAPVPVRSQDFWTDEMATFSSEHDHDEANELAGFEEKEDRLFERAMELEERSLSRRNALMACLGVLSAQQVRLADQLFAAVSAVLESATPDLESLERLAKPMAVLQLVHRQIDRYAITTSRLTEAKKKTDPPPLRPEPLRGFSLDDGRAIRRRDR